jgi:N-sulfoglucosamine sulfohydrolase
MKSNVLKSRMTQTLVAIAALCIIGSNTSLAQTRPNILFCISDDQSYSHTGANGDPVVKTPAFDRIAREGLRFTQ